VKEIREKVDAGNLRMIFASLQENAERILQKQNSKTYKRELALKKKLIEKGLIGKRWDEHRDDVLDFDESEGLSEKTIRTIFNGEDSDESDTEFPKAPPKKADPAPIEIDSGEDVISLASSAEDENKYLKKERSRRRDARSASSESPKKRKRSASSSEERRSRKKKEKKEKKERKRDKEKKNKSYEEKSTSQSERVVRDRQLTRHDDLSDEDDEPMPSSPQPKRRVEIRRVIEPSDQSDNDTSKKKKSKKEKKKKEKKEKKSRRRYSSHSD